MTFRLSARAVFLTYPQATLSNDDLLAHLLSLDHVSYAIICQERHEDGNFHSHACVKWDRKRNIKSHSFFDYAGHHPNIQPVQHFAKSVNYCKKGGDFLEWSDWTEDSSTLHGLDPSNFGNKADYFAAACASKIPFAYADFFWRNSNSSPECTIDASDPVDGEIREPRLTTWFPDFSMERRSILVLGPTGCGKSTWAKLRAPKPSLWVRHIDNLKYFDPDLHKSIIFDDMDFTHWPRTSCLTLVDLDDMTSVNRRYGVTNIPAKTPRVFTANKYPFWMENGSEDPAIARRLIVLDLYLEI